MNLNECEIFLEKFFEDLFCDVDEFFETYEEYVEDYLKKTDNLPIDICIFDIERKRILYDLHYSFLTKCYARFIKKNCT